MTAQSEHIAMETLVTHVQKILLRDLHTLAGELASYPDETKIWSVLPGTANSAGTLCLHLCGNLQHFIGAVLGHNGYIRNRDAEFAIRNVNRKDLLDEVSRTRDAVDRVLASLPVAIAGETYPEKFRNENVSTGYFLLHLVAHFNYHLGQVNYHRRVLSHN